jgi:hypothetical protein
MLSQKTIKYVKLSKETVDKANKLNLSDRTIINHYKSTKQEKWKDSTEDWINKLYNKKFG